MKHSKNLMENSSPKTDELGLKKWIIHGCDVPKNSSRILNKFPIKLKNRRAPDDQKDVRERQRPYCRECGKQAMAFGRITHLRFISQLP